MPLRPPLSELPDADAWGLFERLLSPDPPRLSAPDQLAIVQALRARSPELATQVDQTLLGQIQHQRQGLRQARGHLDDLQGVLDKLTATPWHPAVFLDPIATGDRPAALVSCNGSQRVVGFAAGVEPETIETGDEVLLNQQLSVILRKVETPPHATGESVEFVRALPDGRLSVRHREDEIVVRAARRLDVAALRDGERLLWDRAAGLARERIGVPGGASLFLEETPRDGFEQVGGLDAQIARITRTLRLHVLHADEARRYGVRRTGSVLLVGPPGTGKTMIARALANWLARHAASGQSRFMSVKPGELHSMWYGQSEANYREAFRMARQAGDADPSTPVVMFFDEVDAAGSTRGRGVTRVDDRVLTSFMTELDGLESRGSIFVVAATNRRDMLDPALARPGRLGDLVIDIPRPGMAAAAAIFEKHLPVTIPYAAHGTAAGGDATRRRMIDAAVARLYAPNGEGDVASVTFRDGTRRALQARDLMSGANIANIARAAVESACLREVEHGASGVTIADVLDAIVDEIAAAVSALTPVNCHAHITDLPQDLTIVRVEALVRQVRRPHRFTTAA